MVSTVAGSGQKGCNDGIGAAASFTNPRALDIHPVTGDLYMADAYSHKIRKITSGIVVCGVWLFYANCTQAGVVSTVAGTGAEGSQDGSTHNATFKHPQGIKVAHDGSLLVADSSNNKIRRIHEGIIVHT